MTQSALNIDQRPPVPSYHMVDTPAIALLISTMAVHGGWTVRKILDSSRDCLRESGVEQARFEAEELLAHALGVERLELYLEPDRVLSGGEVTGFRELLIRRREGVPLQYLLGEADFMGFILRVDERALIPRPETEELVELILREVDPGVEWEILELGTGSGAIAIALAKFLPRSRITATDLSQSALELAQENALRNGVWEIAFLNSDWFTALEGQFDLIVANPPYVGQEEIKELPREVREHEPREAWNGGEGGIEALRKIIIEAPSYLRRGGRLYLEIGAAQGAGVQELAAASGAYDGIEIFQDHSGRMRHLRARRRAG